MIYVRWLNSVFRKGTEHGHGNRQRSAVLSTVIGIEFIHFITKHEVLHRVR